MILMLQITPIYWATYHGHTESVKILAPLADNPNAPDKFGNTPTKSTMNVKIHRIKESFTSNTKSKDPDGPSKMPNAKRSKKF